MEDWKVLYASKLMTADEAVRQIPDGSRVFFGHAANEPPVLVDALVRNYEQYKDVEIVHWVPMGKGEYCDPKMKGHLRHNAMFVGGPTRKAVQEGRADYTPFFFHQSTRFFSDGTFPIDVAMVSVTPPDKHGYVSLWRHPRLCRSWAEAPSAKWRKPSAGMWPPWWRTALHCSWASAPSLMRC